MTAKRKRQPGQRRIVRTSAEILANGNILEPILSCASSEPLELAFWNGLQATIAPRTELGGVIYGPAPIERSVFCALYLPAHVAAAESVRRLSARQDIINWTFFVEHGDPDVDAAKDE